MSCSLVIIILPPDFSLKQQVLTTLCALLSSRHVLLSCYPGIQQLMRLGFVAKGSRSPNVAKLSKICVWTIEIDVRPRKFSLAHTPHFYLHGVNELFLKNIFGTVWFAWTKLTDHIHFGAKWFGLFWNTIYCFIQLLSDPTDCQPYNKCNNALSMTD